MAYAEVHPDDMILRDHLAHDRTVLANERTWLAYVRTSLGFLITGGTVMKVFERDVLLQSSGAVFIAIALAIALWGYHRYRSMKRKLAETYAVPRKQQPRAETPGAP